MLFRGFKWDSVVSESYNKMTIELGTHIFYVVGTATRICAHSHTECIETLNGFLR